MKDEAQHSAFLRLIASLSRWAETPYGAGQQRPGRDGAVDCVRFVDAVLREYTSRSPPPVPREAQDASLHDPEVVRRVMRHFLQGFPSETLPEYCARSPRPLYRAGDVLAVSTSTTPMHVGIVGMGGRALWHASIEGVRQTSVQALATSGWSIRGAYRPLLSGGLVCAGA